jgi:hypothetical protein
MSYEVKVEGAAFNRPALAGQAKYLCRMRRILTAGYYPTSRQHALARFRIRRTPSDNVTSPASLPPD